MRIKTTPAPLHFRGRGGFISILPKIIIPVRYSRIYEYDLFILFRCGNWPCLPCERGSWHYVPALTSILFYQNSIRLCSFSRKKSDQGLVSPKFVGFVNLTWNFDFMMNFLYPYIFGEILFNQVFCSSSYLIQKKLKSISGGSITADSDILKSVTVAHYRKPTPAGRPRTTLAD